MLDKFTFVCGFGDDRIVKTAGRDVLLYHANYAKGSQDKVKKLKRVGMFFIAPVANAAGGGEQQPPARYKCA